MFTAARGRYRDYRHLIYVWFPLPYSAILPDTLCKYKAPAPSPERCSTSWRILWLDSRRSRALSYGLCFLVVVNLGICLCRFSLCRSITMTLWGCILVLIVRYTRTVSSFFFRVPVWTAAAGLLIKLNVLFLVRLISGLESLVIFQEPAIFLRVRSHCSFNWVCNDCQWSFTALDTQSDVSCCYLSASSRKEFVIVPHRFCLHLFLFFRNLFNNI